MKISRAWLQTYFDAPLPSDQDLYDALTFHAFEVDDVAQAGNDSVFDVKVTANRGHDCLSHRGIAQELSAILNMPMKNDPLRETPDLSPKTDSLSIDVAVGNTCPRFTAALITGVKVGPSPEWLKASLEAMGQRSINNIVDATNYVMFGLGQPLHAFDAGKLSKSDMGYALSVRFAADGERMTGLDDKEYSLASSMVVIADKNAKDRVVSIAGIKGGKPTGIDGSTSAVILEAANWDGVATRKTSRALNLRTDASARFEQVMSPEVAGCGLKAVVDLVISLCGGTVEGYADEYPAPQKIVPVSVSLSRINSVLGLSLSAPVVADVFKRLDFGFVQDGEIFTVTPPFERLDLVIPEDLIEEVGRIIGYDTVPNVGLPAFASPPEINRNFLMWEKVREYLVMQGFSEVFTSSFAEKGERLVLNKVDGVRPYLRDNLDDGVRDALERNVRIKELLETRLVKIFEIGTIWKNGAEVVDVAIAVEKNRIEYDKDEIIAFARKISTGDRYDELPISATERYQPFSKYPYIVRDIALWVPAGTEADAVLDIIRRHAGELLVKCSLFDRFEKGERVSLAFRLIFQSFEKTLTDAEANAIMETVSAALKEKGFEIR